MNVENVFSNQNIPVRDRVLVASLITRAADEVEHRVSYPGQEITQKVQSNRRGPLEIISSWARAISHPANDSYWLFTDSLKEQSVVLGRLF